LFGQSFSRDHVDFFFSTEIEKKLTSEISALKTDLDLYHFEMDIERQTHQWEEKALRAQVIEREEQKKTAVQEALEKVEAMKRECEGIPSSFVFSSFFLLLAPFCLIFFYYLV
jgi:undecaprenyl pyrophosphate synthase